MAIVLVVATLLLIVRVDRLRTWGETYSAAGQFVVTSCEFDAGVGPDQWRCSGALHAQAVGSTVTTTGAPAHLVTSAGAYVSRQPVAGETIPVFYSYANPQLVYPDADQLGEVSRLYLSMLPMLFLAVGAATWVLGWIGASARSGLLPGIPVPGWLKVRANWQLRGLAWMGAGIVMIGINALVVSRIVGSLGIV